MKLGDWVVLLPGQESGQVIEVTTLWGDQRLRLWLPAQQTMLSVAPERVRPLAQAEHLWSPEALAYLTAAARVGEALTQEVLLAPIGAPVIPLPHQLHALSRAVGGDRIRYLLADEVGLGKTIEAGLILRELKLRGLVRRVLVVAPAGLVTQWVSEMKTHFHEDFRLILSEDLSALERWTSEGNPWQSHPQVVTTMDGIKPLDSRRGWSATDVAEFNRRHIEDLVAAGWDLVIVDESHRLGGSTEDVARHQLGRALAECAPYLLLLSATPHQGKSDAFQRLLSLLDPLAFPDVASLTQERVRPFVIRTEKRHAVTADGQPLFLPRRTELRAIPWQERHQRQRDLYEAATAYARNGYNRALAKQQRHIGFLMVLLQRLVSSSTRAFAHTIERRLAVVRSLRPGSPGTQPPAGTGWFDPRQALEADGEQQITWAVGVDLQGQAEELAELETLLTTARQAEAAGPDPKAEALVDLLQQMQQETGNPEVKILIFTEFLPTQDMLAGFLRARGCTVGCLNGSLDLEDRRTLQRQFATDLRILISTEAGGEGLNLQFCHIVVNYDLPWNPMRIEQRIGRVDRIGQRQVVRAFNLVLADSVEHRVRDVLEEKLAVILAEFGVNKTGDVLDTAEAEVVFERVYRESILAPETVERSVESALAQVRQAAAARRAGAGVLGSEGQVGNNRLEALRDHPIFHWLERMVVSYCRSHGGRAEIQDRRGRRSWNLTWPDGSTAERVVFTPQEAAADPRARHLTLEDPAVRGLAQRPWVWAPGQPIPLVLVGDIPTGVMGYWSLWRIAVRSAYTATSSDDQLSRSHRVLALFMRDDGRVFQPTARRVWDVLIAGEWLAGDPVAGEASANAFSRLRTLAEEHGDPLYRRILDEHRLRLGREREKGERAFRVRREAISRIGLEQVRNHRLAALIAEEATWTAHLKDQEDLRPELTALVLLRVEGAGGI
jgi:superfamily II DNA or RNA helicase